ncbi:MAG: hemerythrin domain-containing protein, partial [Mycobacterium sp.]
MTDRIPASLGRRQLLGISISAASAIGLSACGSSPPEPAPS